ARRARDARTAASGGNRARRAHGRRVHRLRGLGGQALGADRQGLRREERLIPRVQPEFPRFSDAEYATRHQALATFMQQREVDHLLIVTDQRTGNAPQWVTGWPGTVEAFVVFRPGERMTMHVEWYNHLPLARRVAQGVDVRWGEHRGIALAIEELARR